MIIMITRKKYGVSEKYMYKYHYLATVELKEYGYLATDELFFFTWCIGKIHQCTFVINYIDLSSR